jgi:hypothetical protein
MNFRQLARELVAVTVASLLAVTTWGAPGSPPDILGTVSNSQYATVAGAALADGTNIYDGDVISTADRGGAWIMLPGGAGILLGQNTEAQIRRDSANGPIDFDIAQGEVRFRSTDKTLVQGFLYDATISAANSPIASGYVEYTSATTAIIGAETGTLLVTTLHDGGSRIIPAGSLMEVHMLAASQEQQDRNRTAKRRTGLIVLLGIVLIGTATILAIVLNHHERHHVSPSSFPQ